jgi:hypothetical protein
MHFQFHTKTHLGETLAKQNVVSLLDKVPDGKGILQRITRGETLVSHVEERKVLLLLHQVRELFPLSFSGVNSGRVLILSVPSCRTEMR